MTKDGKAAKVFPALKWLAAICFHTSNQPFDLSWDVSTQLTL